MLPLVGLELPGVPGTAPDVAPWPVGVAEPEVLSEDEPEDMPDELLGLVDEDEELPDVP
ncbi:hypothetical protein [Noviherbaspirillum denitrificans]|uniref:hypothetical protein n=1 Tax=Noviherbaspirillum denitrificans TaxID=1968433 RepID=UPI001483B22E|nr:hypothetical protein [Noviherbaspirillum denitrificans]